MRFDITRRARIRWLLAVLWALGAPWLAPAIRPAQANQAARAPSLHIDQAWIRWLPAGVPGGGYLTLTNLGEQGVIIVGASSPAYGMVELHRTVHRGANVEMVPAERIPIAAHATLDFAAAGYHFMLMDESRPLKPGDRVPITLRFADGSSLTVPFEVRR